MEKTAVITGASKGVGRALSVCLARNGWRVALLSRNEEGLFATYKQLPTRENSWHIVQPTDISIWADCQAATSRIAQQFGHVNLLINNAFGYGEDSLADIDPGQVYDFFATSAAGTALITKSCLDLLKSAYTATTRKSQIINIVADWGFPMQNILSGPSVYVAGKYAVHGFGVALHKEIAADGINVSNIYPGIIASGFSIDEPIEDIRGEHGNAAIPLSVICDTVLFVAGAEHVVFRHIVLSPDDPEYNGL